MQRALQVRRIKEIGEALVLAGVSSLDDQACALGLCRSTAWSLLKASHKNSGLSASVVNAILKSPKLPPEVRSKVLQYVEEKISGCYGHRPRQISRFAAQLALSKQIARSRSVGFDTTQPPKTAANSPIRPTVSLTLPRPANSLAPAPPIALSPSVTGDATAMPSRGEDDDSEPLVSLASIGNCEIRMFRGREADLDGMTLFWLELFNHFTKSSYSFRCHRIKDAAAVFDDLMSQAACLDKPDPAAPTSNN